MNNDSFLRSLTDEALKTSDSANPNPKNKVYRKTNGNLTLSSGNGDILVSGSVKTVIVENGNLIINSNIKYADKNSVVAFLVVNGNKRIDKGVTELVGIFAAINVDKIQGKGKIERTEQSSREITIRGSVYGDIEPLFLGTTATNILTLHN